MENEKDPSCIFCKIAHHDIDSNFVFENEHCVAFRDIKPKAKTHVLVVPKIHLATLKDADTHPDVFITLWSAVLKTAKVLGVQDQAKLEVHSGVKAGQEIPHLHVHILSNK